MRGDADVNEVSERIIGCAFRVSNELGCGFLEKVYENALVHLLSKNGSKVAQQVKLNVWFDDVVVGDYTADIIVDNKVLVEVKASEGLDEVHTAQCLNYLKTTKLPLCLLINFGKPNVQLKRLKI